MTFQARVLRFIATIFLRLMYRINIEGMENIPKKGGALIACNHQSYLDAPILYCLLPRRMRFLFAENLMEHPVMGYLGRATRAIPIHSQQSPRELIKSLRNATEAIEKGEVIGIFPEGQVTRIGSLLPFRRGFERIVRDVEAPIVPIVIEGAYDTAFALRDGRFHFYLNPFVRRKTIHVVIGKPLEAEISHFELRQHFTELMGEAYEMRKPLAKPMHMAALAHLRKHPLRKKWADHASGKMVRNWRILAGTVVVGTKLRRYWDSEEFIGLALPPSIGGVVVNLAALLSGKVPVNLNYSASVEINEHICHQCDINLIITSRAFVDKARLQLPEGREVVFLEDVRQEVEGSDRLAGILKGLLMPAGMLSRSLGATRVAEMGDLCTLIFSSGSTGTPKGIQLSHWNIWSNCYAVSQILPSLMESTLLGILPFFHSFGFTITLSLPLMMKVKVAYYPTPLEPRAIADQVLKYDVNILLATPTFLAAYTRRVDPELFSTINFVLTGAEKLRDSVRDGFEKKFGIRPVEGYGCTETSPVISANTINFRGGGVFQRGVRVGSVGQPIPGVSIQIRDIDTGEVLPPGKAGMLFVKGPNVMQGYYKMPDKTREALQDGWYRTGDVAKLDEDGFITITDRLARFSKIGGEMVPHVKVEEALHRLLGLDEQKFAVTGVRDEKKGERLVVLYTGDEEEAQEARKRLPEMGIPQLWIPKWQDFIKVEEIPVLGSGKLDVKRVKAIAEEERGEKREGVAE